MEMNKILASRWKNCCRNTSWNGPTFSLPPSFVSGIFIETCDWFSYNLAPSDQGESALTALRTSLANLQLDYLDLYLIHWPGVSGIPTNHPENRVRRQASWKALARGKESGLVRDIGVSNYTVRHLEELLSNCGGIKPAVNQVRFKCSMVSLK